MSDDPNRDLLPVKDDSCYGSVRCSSAIDPRERHLVCKLDRYQLEDRYLRLLDEVQGLKKLSNSQEDKIKRLATKLMRSAATSSICTNAFAINDDRDRVTRLELENARLKDRSYNTSRNQLLSCRGCSPTRSRRVGSGLSSSPTTYRTDSARMKYQPQTSRKTVDDNDVQNYLVKIEELESQRNEMGERIAELESQIALQVTGAQKEKVQDNVEYIRMWRQVKQANDKLVSVQAANDTLSAQIGDLKGLLEETTKNNREVTAALVSEKQRLSEIDDQIASAKKSQLSLREKDEQIRDLTNELKILQQHNNELIALSSKFGQIELENVELKRKITEYVQDNQTLKSAFNSEQAEHATLRAANNNLLEKIEVLEKNMDNLTMQLMTLQNCGERWLISATTQTEKNQADKRTGTTNQAEIRCTSCKKEEESFYDEIRAERDEESCNDERILRFTREQNSPRVKPKLTKSMTNSMDHSRTKNVQTSGPSSRGSSAKSFEIDGKQGNCLESSANSMSREKILKLLDQAQISTPLEVQNAARIRQIDVCAAGQNDASKFPESYRIPVTSLSRSNDCCTLMDVRSTPDHDEQTELCDPNQILLSLFEILRGYSESIQRSRSHPCTCGEIKSRNGLHYQTTNFDSKKIVEKPAKDSRETCAILYRESANSSRNKSHITDRETNRNRNFLHKFTETECCNCDSNHRCFTASDCRYECCTPDSDDGHTLLDRNFCSQKPATVRFGFGEIGSTINEALDSMCLRRDNNRTDTECFDPCSEGLPENVKQHCNLNTGCKKEKSFSNCETDRHSANEYGDMPALCEIAAFPLIITKGQGLVEIHILSLQLSAKAKQSLFKNNPNDISVFVSWDVWGQERARTPILKYPSLSFHSSSVYRVCELQNFFDFVLREHIVFQVHVINPDEETLTVAKAELSVKDILDYPQNKLHYVTPVVSVMPCSCGGNFGQLSLWIRLSCDTNLVERFKDRCGLVSAVPKRTHNQLLSEERKEDPFAYSADVTQGDRNLSGCSAMVSRLETIPESVELGYGAESDEHVPEKGKYRKREANEEESNTNAEQNDSIETSITDNDNDTQDSDDEEDEKYDAEARKFESFVSTTRRLKLEEFRKQLNKAQQVESRSITEFNTLLKYTTKRPNAAALSPKGSPIDDLGNVISDDKWEQFKLNGERSNFSLQVKSDDPKVEGSQNVIGNVNSPAKDAVTITIVRMNLFDKTSLMNDPEIDLLYIEYTFLGVQGAEMETVSLHKSKNRSESMTYNFTKKFEVDEETHNSQRTMLTSMLSGTSNPNIKFLVVCEPLPEEMDSKECVEVGHAILNIREYALGDGLRNVPLIIMNPLQSEQIGILKITIGGVEIIRNCMMVQKRI